MLEFFQLYVSFLSSLYSSSSNLPSHHSKNPFSTTQIMELTSMRLLFRTSPIDRLDGPPMFKCAISYDATLALAKQLMIPLADLLWDPI